MKNIFPPSACERDDEGIRTADLTRGSRCFYTREQELLPTVPTSPRGIYGSFYANSQDYGIPFSGSCAGDTRHEYPQTRRARTCTPFDHHPPPRERRNYKSRVLSKYPAEGIFLNFSTVSEAGGRGGSFLIWPSERYIIPLHYWDLFVRHFRECNRGLILWESTSAFVKSISNVTFLEEI